jgi:hypothetical protein
MDDRTWVGALAEARVVAALVEERWDVFTSCTGKSPFDLVIARSGSLLRVEVKGCATQRPNGGYRVNLRSVRPNRTGNVVRRLSPDTSDVLALYLHPADKVCFFRTVDLAGRNTITLHEAGSRLDPRRILVSDYAKLPSGAVAEWTKATALKVVDPQGSVGSNPTRSARVSSSVHPGVVAESG